jgi:hypothetical protein
MRFPATEVVNGTVIGKMTLPYRFYTTDLDDPKPITKMMWFANDTEAIEWFKENHPKAFKVGAEMRCYR